MIYLDTSVLGAIFFREPNASLVFRQVRTARANRLVISSWTLTEMASVGAIKERMGVIDHETRLKALSSFRRFASFRLALTEIEPTDFRTAALLIEGPGSLRAGDALHLAVARRLPAKLATLDRRLADAAPIWGVPLLPVG
ncbi:MAG: type II toxin-antitoxin system VapC family toxin [Candidatus Contendobacter sp.]